MRNPFRFLQTLGLVLALFGAQSTIAFAISCDTDCGEYASFRYPCPTLTNPHRMCTGRNPVKFANCEAQRPLQCESLARALVYAGRAHFDKRQCIVDIVSAGPGTAICGSCIASAITTGGSTAIFCSLASCVLAAQDLVRARDTCL